jgi:NADPH-dependent glutamate synthase beta subunit-like oxidoreductase
MPADQEEIDEAKEEGVNIVPQAIPVRVEDRDGRAAFIWGEAAMQDQGPGKRPKPILQEDKIHTQEYDTIVPAIGQGTGYTFLPEEYSDRIGIVRYQVQTGVHGETGEARIFAGGDIANKTKDAISAIADGHRAAIGMDRAMRKEGS